MHFDRFLPFIWLLGCSSALVVAQDRPTSGPMELLLQHVWDQANVTSNFIMAPLEIFSLYRNIYSNDSAIENPISLPYIISNRTAVKVDKGSPALINGVTIKARWTYNFQRRDGHKRLFHSTRHAHVYTDFMRKDDIFLFTELPAEFDGTAVEIPLHQHEVKMLILLPNGKEGLPQLEQKIFQNLSAFQDVVIHRLQPTVVRVYIPKFKIHGLVHLLDAFQEYATNISPAAAGAASPQFSDVRQRAQLEVNENGIGQAEATVLFWNASSSLRIAPKIFEMNHPFLFLIRSARGIEFVGRVVYI